MLNLTQPGGLAPARSPRAWVVLGLWLFQPAWAMAAAPATPQSRLDEAERLAAQSMGLAGSRPGEALDLAQRALRLTADFEPTAYVRAGRKGEVVEDAYLAARAEYRGHRARLYRAAGLSLAAAGRQDAAARYLRRALDLGGEADVASDLARSLVAAGRGCEALDVILDSAGALGTASLTPEALRVASAAADAAGVASLQVELDRLRLAALPVDVRPELRDGPFRLGGRERLSTGAPLRLDDDRLTVLYLADAACRTCSADLETLRRGLPAGTRAILAPPGPDQDRTLRQAAQLYRLDWPVALGPSLAATLDLPAPSVVLLARRSLLAVVLRPPLVPALSLVLEALARQDVSEPLPRAAFNQRPADRTRQPRPGLLPEGLAPGEDERAPAAFGEAVLAYRAGRFAEALRGFEAVEAAGDGWLLPPEARLDRALCLAGLGRREEARLLLLRTGDSRFQDALDAALERVGSPRKGRTAGARDR